jgi:putative peptidoglycan lipid II flippase
MGALNTKKVFFVPALAPAMLNVTTIAVVLAFAPMAEQPLLVVAVGIALGGFVQFAFQLPVFFRNGYSLGLDPGFRHPGLKKMAFLILPATMALAVNQINIIVSNILASYLQEGSITYLYYSMRLIQFPVGIFGVAMGMAVLPALSEHAVKGDFDRLREDFSFALRLLFFIAVPSMAGLVALREPIVNLLFQRGQFDYAATRGTAEALFFYAIGIWSIVGVRVITATFYSMQDTRTPVKIAAVGVASNLLLSLVLMGPLKHSGLALANSLASGINFLILFIFLKKKLHHIDAGKIAKSFSQIVLSSFVMGLAGWFLLRGELWTKSGSAATKAVYLSGTMIICIIIYVTVNSLVKNEELQYVRGMIMKKLGKG